jgi:esterase/lipase
MILLILTLIFAVLGVVITAIIALFDYKRRYRPNLDHHQLFSPSSKPQTKVSVLLLHGFGITPAVFFSLHNKLSTVDIHVNTPLLIPQRKIDKPPHYLSRQDWIELSTASYENCLKHSEKCIVVGFSMGCLLALNLIKQSQKPKALVMIAPFFEIPFFHKPCSAILTCSTWAPWLYIPNKPADCRSQEKCSHMLFPKFTSLKATRELFLLSRETQNRVDLDLLPQTVAFHGNHDRVASYKKSYETLSSRTEFHSINRGHHYLLQEDCSELIESRILELVSSLL